MEEANGSEPKSATNSGLSGVNIFAADVAVEAWKKFLLRFEEHVS